MTQKTKALRDRLADLEHEQWMSWAKSILTTEQISAKRKERWVKCFIPYDELSDEMKEHDLVWADRVLAIVGEENDKLKAENERLREALKWYKDTEEALKETGDKE